MRLGAARTVIEIGTHQYDAETTCGGWTKSKRRNNDKTGAGSARVAVARAEPR